MKAMVLTAGEGTRLRPLTERRPKPLLPLAGRPLLYYTLDLLALHGVEEAVLNLYHQAAAFETAFAAMPHPHLKVHFSRESQLLGTAGAVRYARSHFDGTFFLIHGDNLADVDLDALAARHRESGAVATIGLFRPRDPTAVGIVEQDADGWVRAFREKPRREELPPPPHAANAGVYVLEPAVLDWIPEEGPSDWGHQIFPSLLRDGLPIMAQFLHGHLRDTGTSHGYLRAHRDLLAGRCPRLWQPASRGFRPLGRLAWAHGTAHVAASSQVGDLVLVGPEAVVERDARLGVGAVVGAQARLEPGSRVVGSVLGDGCHLARGATVCGAVVGAGCRLECKCHVMQDVIIGEHALIRAGAVVAPGTRVPAGATWP